MQFLSLPINSSHQNNPRYKCSLKSENIEILLILSAAILKMAAIRPRFFLVRIFYLPYLIYMLSLAEIPLWGQRFWHTFTFPWQRRLFRKSQDLNAPLEVGIHLPVKFSKDRIIILWEFGRTSSFGEEEGE